MKLRELFEEEERSVLSVMGQQLDPYVGNFYCGDRQLTSLKGSPSKIDGNFHCDVNLLKSLEGGPREVDGFFTCSHNLLTSLEGAPTNIGADFYCENNKLTSLRGIHKHIKYIKGIADFNVNPIKSHVLGLLKIDGLYRVYLDNEKIEKIIEEHLQGDRDIFACQEELIEAGFPEYAQL